MRARERESIHHRANAAYAKRNKPLGKAEQEQFMQKLFRETDATLPDVLRSWNRVAVKQKKIRSLVEKAR